MKLPVTDLKMYETFYHGGVAYHRVPSSVDKDKDGVNFIVGESLETQKKFMFGRGIKVDTDNAPLYIVYLPGESPTIFGVYSTQIMAEKAANKLLLQSKRCSIQEILVDRLYDTGICLEQFLPC